MLRVPSTIVMTLLGALLLGCTLSLPVHPRDEPARATGSKSSSHDRLSDSLNAGQAAAEAGSAAVDAAKKKKTAMTSLPASPHVADGLVGGGSGEAGEATAAPTAAPSGSPLFNQIAEVASGAPLLS